MTDLDQLIEDTERCVDGECNYEAPEYRALRGLLDIARILARENEKLRLSVRAAANDASCRANGMFPD